MLSDANSGKITCRAATPPVSLPSRNRPTENVANGGSRRRISYQQTPPSYHTQVRTLTASIVATRQVGQRSINGNPVRAQGGEPPSDPDKSDELPRGDSGASRKMPKIPLPLGGRRNIPQNRFPKFFLGIETEMLLQARDEHTRRKDIISFLSTMATLHNEKVGDTCPKMDAKGEDDDIWMGQSDCSWWILMEEEKLISAEEKLTCDIWGVELKTPKMNVSDNPNWTNIVKETWAFIKMNYSVNVNEMCSTHVHISMQCGAQPGTQLIIGMGLRNIKKVAQCAIHWETALEALVSMERRRNIFATSNWIDNLSFAEERITRRVAIEMIEKCGTEEEVIRLMCPGPQERFYAWNFWSLRKHGTIEFRKGSASVNADEALAWAEFTLLFVKAAVEVSPHSLKTVPSNVGELKQFLGVDKLKYLKPMFDRMNGEESLQPIPLTYVTIERAFLLEKKIRADEEEQRKLREGRRPP